MTLPFEENKDIPDSHLYAFKVCNSAPKYWWKHQFYKLKNEILEKYGRFADYDLQHIVKKCHSCDGKGNHYRGRCWNCDKGVYARKDVLLKRYLLNGSVFHKPVGELVGNRIKIFDGYESYEDHWGGYDSYPKFRHETFDDKIVGTIHGLIKHEPMKLNPLWAYYYLLWCYDKPKFFHCIESDIKSYQTNAQSKIKKLLKKYTPLQAFAEFLKVKKEELQPIDDLPF